MWCGQTTVSELASRSAKSLKEDRMEHTVAMATDVASYLPSTDTNLTTHADLDTDTDLTVDANLCERDTRWALMAVAQYTPSTGTDLDTPDTDLDTPDTDPTFCADCYIIVIDQARYDQNLNKVKKVSSENIKSIH